LDSCTFDVAYSAKNQRQVCYYGTGNLKFWKMCVWEHWII